MSLVLSFNICQANTCQSMTFTETTGAYSASNLTGWGAPNEATSDALAAYLYITDPSGTVTTINLFTQTPAWPTTSSTQEYEITPSDLNQGSGNFTDGLYKFVYKVFFDELGTDTTQTTVYQFFYCNINCCVNQMFAKIIDPSCDCQADAIAAASKADALLTGLKRAAACAKTSLFDSLLTILQKLCTNSNCNTCN